MTARFRRKRAKKSRVFWWHMARNPKLSVPPGTRWCPMCFVTDKYNTIFEPVFDIDNPFILKVFVVTTVLNILKKDCKLEPLGNLNVDIEDIVAGATAFMGKCYGSTVQGSLPDIGYNIWLKKTSKRKVTAKLKLQTLPTDLTTNSRSLKENVNREHLQACILKSALSYDPTDMDPCKFEWSKDELTKSLVRISVPSDVPAAPNDIHNPNTFTGWWGRCKKTSRRRKEGWKGKKRMQRARG